MSASSGMMLKKVICIHEGVITSQAVVSLDVSAYALRTFGVHSVRPDFVGSKRELSPTRARH